MKTLDLRQHQCPEPVVMTRRELLDNPSAPLAVLVGDDTARENICRLAETMGYGINVMESGDTLSLELTPGDGSTTAASPQSHDRTVLLLTTDVLGQGDDELGSVLMRNYLITLTEMERTPDTILLLNAGVKLASDGSDALEALENLKQRDPHLPPKKHGIAPM